MSIESIQRLGRAYYAIPAGEPSTEQVLEQLPDLYAAIEELLTETDQYSGLLAALGNAREQGYPIHVATEQGDDKRDNFAFSGRAVQDDGLPERTRLRRALLDLAGLDYAYDARLDSGDYGNLERPYELADRIIEAYRAAPALHDPQESERP